MRSRSSTRTSSDPWAPYVPDNDAPWDLRRVVHLHRRAGFAATWDEIQRDLNDGPEAVDRPAPGGEVPIPRHPRGVRRVRRPPGRPGVAAPATNRLKAWWVYRMLFGPDPLAERLTLMWHNHFATSNLKVNDLG